MWALVQAALGRARLLLVGACSMLLSPVSWGQGSASEFFVSTQQASLAEAAAEGRVQSLDQLVKHGADPNAAGRDGMTASYWAVLHRSKAGLQYLLEHGANPNVIFSRDGTSATSIAAKLEDPWFLSEILAHKGDVNIRNPLNGRTPLFEALYSGRNSNARLLIAKGADINVHNYLGSTPLTLAVGNQRFDLAYDMLLAGADPQSGGASVSRRCCAIMRISFDCLSSTRLPPWQCSTEKCVT